MRLGSDSGRNFLSTRDPVKTGLNRKDSPKKDSAVIDEHPGRLNDLLRRYFAGRNVKQ